ncbi:MAG: MarR family winged helix-turn-helix transcriptional regulator, partial [Gammaproteobacteria bacterium]
ELSTRTLVLAPSLVGVIDRLEAAGLVRRQRSPSDRRQVLIKLTTAGRKLESEVVPAVETIYQELRNAIASDVYDELMRGLDALSRVAPLQQTQAQELSTHEPSK